MKSAKHRVITLATIAVLMALSLTFLAPSAAILPEAEQRYLDELLPDWDELSNAWDFNLDGTVGYVASAGLIDAILPTNDIAYLSVDASEIGRVPIQENFTETGYQDDTIIVEIVEERAYDSTFHVAYVKIATPSQLRTSVSSGKYGDTPTTFSMAMNAVVLINGDYYTKWANGYIVRQGEIYRWNASPATDLLLIDENSDLHIVVHTGDKADEEAAVEAFLEEHELINAFFFGPALVVDGELMDIPEEYLGSPHADNPRAAIGQIAPLTYALVTVDGRTDESAGITVDELAAYMYDIGCQQAYALDGGNSSALVFNHVLLSQKDVKERQIPDTIYFATAIDN